MSKITKAELAKALREVANANVTCDAQLLSVKGASAIVINMLEVLKEHVKAVGTASIPGLATFNAVQKASRPGRNLHTGEVVEIAARTRTQVIFATTPKEQLSNCKLFSVIALRTGVSTQAVKAVFSVIASAVVNKQAIELRGFGVFWYTYNTERTARNPKTGEVVLAAASIIPHFKPSNLFVDYLTE